MIGFVLVVGFAGFLGACLLKGFGPPVSVASFVPERSIKKEFREAEATCIDAYRRAIAHTPGMRLVDDSGSALLVDLRPTSQILGGNFGMALRVRGEGTPLGGGVMTIEGMKKVPFAIANHDAAFTHAERALRMRAKELGLSEVVSL